MNTVNKKRPLVEETALLEPREWGRAVGNLRDLEIDRILGEVDMTTDIVRTSQGCFVEGLVRDGEAGVKSEGATDARVISVGVNEPEVLDETRDGAVVAVAIRDFVAQHCRKASLLDDVSDEIEAATNGRR